MSDWLISYTKIFVIARWICTKWHYFSKCANFGCRRPKMTNFIPKWPSLPRLNDRSGFLSVSKRGIWLQYARSTKHSLYYNANKQYGHVCTRCFFDIKAVSTRLVTSKGIMYIKASNMVRPFNVKLTAVQSTIENQSAAYRAHSAAYSAISVAYIVRFPQHIVRFPQHIVRFRT